MSFLGGLQQDTSKVNAIAEETTEILFIPIDKVGLLIKEFPEWLEYIFRLYHQRFKELLEVVLRDIIVEYDHTQKVHILTINFNIPVLFRDGNEGQELTRVMITPPKSGRKSLKPNSTLPYYSTVTLFAKFLGLSTSKPRRTPM